MDIKFRTLTDGRIAASIAGSYVEGFGQTKDQAILELKRWLDIDGSIKWIDALTGREVK